MIVLTGFEPFKGYSRNPSWEAVLRADVDAEKIRVPVTFSGAREWAERIAEMRPERVVALGLAEARTQISVERVAINLMDSRMPDNEGYAPDEEKVYEDGPDAYITRFPVKRLVEKLGEEGIPAYISNTAGTYVCNAFYYALLHKVGGEAVFIHVPPDEVMALSTKKAYVPLEHMARAVEVVATLR
jgi:pyroglutamyl-peptidase